MNQPNSTTAMRRTTLSLALAALLAATAAPVLGQSESPEPTQTADPEAALSDAPASPAAEVMGSAQALVSALPAELGGVAIDPDNVSVLSGPAVTQGSETLERQYQAIEDATGVAVAEMALLNTFVQTPDDDLIYFGGILVPGADAEVVLDTLLTIVAEEGEATVSEMELGELPVTVIVEDGLVASTTYIYPSGDIMWLVLGPEEAAAEALAYVAG